MQPSLPAAEGHFLISTPSQLQVQLHYQEEIAQCYECCKRLHAAGVALFNDPQNQMQTSLLQTAVKGSYSFEWNICEISDPCIFFVRASLAAARRFGELALTLNGRSSVPTSLSNDPFLRALDAKSIKIYQRFQVLAEQLCQNTNDSEAHLKLRLKIVVAYGIHNELRKRGEDRRLAYLDSNITFAKTIVEKIEWIVKKTKPVADPTAYLHGRVDPSSSLHQIMQEALRQRREAFADSSCPATYQNLQQVCSYAQHLLSAPSTVPVSDQHISALSKEIDYAEAVLKQTTFHAGQG